MSTFLFLLVSRACLSCETQAFLFFCRVCAPKWGGGGGVGRWSSMMNVRMFFLAECCKLSFYANESCDEHAVYFRRWLKWSAMFITYLLSSNDVIFSNPYPWVSCIYTRVRNQFGSKSWNTIKKSRYPEEYWTVDKVERKRFLARNNVELVASPDFLSFLQARETCRFYIKSVLVLVGVTSHLW